MNSLITQTELARISGTTRQTVYKAVISGYIKTKKVKNKKKVIFDDDLTQLWYQKQVAKNAEAPLQGKTKREKWLTGEKSGDGKPAESLINLQREKILEEIGRLRADKKLKELQLQQRRDVLIPKDTVGAVLFQYLDALNINMLDIPDMVIDNIIDKVKADASRGDIVEIMRDAIRKPILITKRQIKERLK